jgi:hypothetical protein
MILQEVTQSDQVYASNIHIQGCREHKWNTFQLARYIIQNNIEGDFCEAGVAGGGHIAYIHKVLKENKITDRKIHLYDSFCGHPKGDGTDHEEVICPGNPVLASQHPGASHVWIG